MPLSRDRPSAVVAWSLYDLANTIYYLLVVTVFAPKLVATLAGTERFFSYGFVPAMIASALLAPGFGALLARRGGAKRWTVVFTALACLFTVLLERPMDRGVVVACFGASLFAYQLASVSYQSLLPFLVSPPRVGRVSGLGVALGYFGNILALALLTWTDYESRFGVRAVFPLAAGLFLAFTLPLALRVPEAPATRGAGRRFRPFADTGAALRSQLSRPPVLFFLVGNLLVCDALNTVLVQMGRYAERPQGLGLEPAQRNHLLLAINVCAVLGGLLLGRLSDRWSGKAVALASAAALGGALAGAQFLTAPLLRVAAMAVLGGFGVAGVWTAGRHWLVQLTEEKDAGEAFGLYGLTLKISFVSLPVFTVLFDRAASYRLPVLVLLVFLAAGLCVWVWIPARRQPPDAGAEP